MQSSFVWLQAITPIHVGAGQTGSLIDLPVMREATTGYPFIPGSGMKGALRDEQRLGIARKLYAKNKTEFDSKAQKLVGADRSGWALALEEADKSESVSALFGLQESAGQLLIGDAKIAYLPMRSLEHAFVWVTCPFVLWRLKRDLEFVVPDVGLDLEKLSPIAGKSGSEAIFSGSAVHVEDYLIDKSSASGFDAKTFFKDIFPHGYAREDFGNVIIVNDALFNYLTRRRLPVRMRNRLEPETKVVAKGALWSEESLPPETILYSVISDRSADGAALSQYRKTAPRHVQVGGNESVGEGWLSLAFREA